MNLFDRQIINVLAQSIKVDLRISDTQLGLLTGTSFGLFYAFMGIPLGRLGDRVDRIKLVSSALVAWSVLTGACGLVGSFMQLFIVRAGVGIGEAASQPASASLVADLFAGSRRTSAMATFLLGIPTGSFLGLLFGGTIGAALGWRAAFLIAGIPGILLAIVMATTVTDPDRANRSWRASAGVATSTGGIVATIVMLFKRPGFGWLILAMMCSAFQVYAGGAWLPPFFIRNYGMTTAQIGGFAAAAVGLGGFIGGLGGGALCDRLRHRVDGVESKVLMAAIGLSAPAMIATVMVHDRTIALFSMFLFNIFCFGYMGPGTYLIQQAATRTTRGFAVALSTTIASITSLSMGLPLVGAVSDGLTPHFGSRAAGYALLLCAVAGCLGVFFNWRVGKALARARVAETPLDKD